MAGNRNTRDFDRDDYETDDLRDRGASGGDQGRYRGGQSSGYGQQRGEQHSPGSFNHDPESSSAGSDRGSNADYGQRGGQQGGYDRNYGGGQSGYGPDYSSGRGRRPYGSQQGGYEDRSGYSGRGSSDTNDRWTGDHGRTGGGSGEFAGRYGQRGDYARSDQGSSNNGGRDFGGRDYGAHNYGQGGWANEGRVRDWNDRSNNWNDRASGWSGRSHENYDRGRAGSGGSGDRGFWDKASDEVSSWFGDEDAERRRKQDEHRGRGPKTYSRSDDRIKEDVNDRLTDEGSLDASDIVVSVINQEVTLSGAVSSRNGKRRAEDVAEMVSGVKHVQNNLRVNDDMRGAGSWASGSSAGSTTGSSYGDRASGGSTAGAAGSPTSGSSVAGGPPSSSSTSGGSSTGAGAGTGASTGTTSVTGSTIGTKSTP